MTDNRIAVIIPTLWRANKLDPLVTNIINTTPVDKFTIYFVVDIEDRESHGVIQGIDWPIGMIIAAQRGYVHAMNLGVQATDEPLLLLTNDDVHFHSGWYDTAIAHLSDEICVLSPNDLSPATAENGCTMPIVRRSYINELGGNFNTPGLAYCEDYHHNFAETELWQLAWQRRVGRFVNACVIEHCHPDWSKGTLDQTYEQGAKQHWDEDQALFNQRKAQWIQIGA